MIEALPFLAVISAVLHTRADVVQKRKQTYFLKPLTLMLLISFALFQHAELSTLYKVLIIFGLTFSMVGDVFLMLRSDKFLQGLISFFVAHILYLLAFIGEIEPPLNFMLLVPALAIQVAYLKVVLPKSGKLALPVIVYSTILAILFWVGMNRMFFGSTESGLIAGIGVLFFLSSDAALGINRFVKPWRGAQVFILTSYYIAQLLFVYSI